ncbi:TVP38/TMEM64 family protein [Methylocaldum szegediense]|uniref:TVP38/TMEM64 family membrane protein n=1 Tax=Methylocaldum szegediense TaxID=73780 RepID=A0ABN8XB55_9GAMM|nr:VTT domain-containing protein [Methylocaldum szegediense]CAI8944687.1 TVP38/TMEM64 family membrane protein [Methylocaldum szegediense]
MVDVQRLKGAAQTAGIFRYASVAGLLSLGVVFYFTPLKAWLADGLMLKAELASYGLAAPLIFTSAGAVLTAIGAPRLILCSLGGLVFGFAWGLVWSQLATVLGSYLTLLLVRRFRIGYGLRKVRQFERLVRQIACNGVLAVVLIRQLPLNNFYNNVLLGLTDVRHVDFLVGSLIGFLPMGITACLIGAGLLQTDFARAAEYISLGFASSVILGYALNRLRAFVYVKNADWSFLADKDS